MSGTEDIVTRLRMLGGLDAALCNKAADEIERLRELSGNAGQLREERDEARRSVCCQALPSDYRDWKPSAVDSALKLIAAQQGWDCFKEEK